MRFPLSLRLAAAAAALALSGAAAHAAPSCTGTTTVITVSPTTFQDSDLVDTTGQSNGNCVQAGDKLFGNFTFGAAGSQLPFTGEITEFNVPVSTPLVGDYQLSFSTDLHTSATGFGYEVTTLDPTVALINDLEKDADFNGITGSAIALAGSVNGVPMINCSRTLGGGGTCPEIATFAPIQDVVVRENATTSGGAILSNITDTISQVTPVQSIPEPSTLALLGGALIVMWLARQARGSQRRLTDPRSARPSVACHPPVGCLAARRATTGLKPERIMPAGTFSDLQPGGPMTTETVMSAAFRAAGHETPGDKLFGMMREAILATGGANFDAAADQFIKRLLAEEDARLVWELMAEVRMLPVKKLFGVVRHLVREEQAKTVGQGNPETRAKRAGAAADGGAGQRADETRTPPAPSPSVAPTARPGLSTPVKSPPPPARTVPPPRGATPTMALPDLARQSQLERFVVNGKPIGDLTRAQALSAKMREESDVRFIELLVTQLPPGSNHRIRDYIKPEEADSYFKMAQQSNAA